jgi:uncharacterized protein YdeI (YjbR/CyaY-like superfamily)
MPADVGERLESSGTRTAYDERPAYQRNDYLMWISETKTSETRDKRIRQMIDELKRGDVYMKMAWKAAGSDN